MRRMLVLICVLASAGCASTPIATELAIPIPGDRHLLYKMNQAGTAPVIIKRDTGFGGAACNTRVFVDGKLAALVGTGEKVTLYIPEGDVVFGAESNSPCGGGLVEQGARIVAGKQAQFRIAIGQGGDIGFYPTATK